MRRSGSRAEPQPPRGTGSDGQGRNGLARPVDPGRRGFGRPGIGRRNRRSACSQPKSQNRRPSDKSRPASSRSKPVHARTVSRPPSHHAALFGSRSHADHECLTDSFRTSRPSGAWCPPRCSRAAIHAPGGCSPTARRVRDGPASGRSRKPLKAARGRAGGLPAAGCQTSPARRPSCTIGESLIRRRRGTNRIKRLAHVAPEAARPGGPTMPHWNLSGCLTYLRGAAPHRSGFIVAGYVIGERSSPGS